MYPIQPAQIDWQNDPLGEIPISKQFGDVYFSRDNGLLETRHVFLQGNDLSTRLAALAAHQQFIVGETGFGTGLNFLALWQLWREVKPNNHSHLHMVSVEKYPLSLADLTRALAAWPELAQLSGQLLAQYPPALAGVHRLIFADERISLDVWLGDAADCLPMIDSHRPFDAWFLDGFAPACNPELWQTHIFSHIIRLSGVGTTFASFSVAGILKQGLRAHGITVTRPKGFGKKREMLKAWWPAPADAAAKPLNQHTQHLAVIGAGIAGLSMAYALARRGHRVTIMDRESPLSGASGNPRALLAPKLARIGAVHENLHTIGWLATTRWWSAWSDQVIEPNGVVFLSTEKMPIDPAKFSDYPAEICSPIRIKDQAALSIPRGALLKPDALAQHVLAHPLIDVRHANVTTFWPADQQWQLFADDTLLGQYDQVVLCTAKDSQTLCPQLPKLSAIRGQVSWATLDAAQLPSTSYSYGGYCAPMQHEGKPALLFGASFIRQDDQADLRDADHQHNADLLKASLPEVAQALPPSATWQGRAAIRAQTRDYLPMVGAVPHLDKVWVMAGLGSKGFCFAPMCAELLCAQMLGECVPLPTAVVKQLEVMRAALWR